MKVSEKEGLELIKHFEGLCFYAYQCLTNVWTIGYGHTASERPGDVISAEEADTFLYQDVVDAERTVNNVVRISINQYQFDALVSFVFNLGAGNFRSSMLLKKLNISNYACG
ncbi:hypothetical protein BB987_08330 [Photorhabdus temperata]|uniref:Lysozyme n=1 Tax=Photorhabdus khanii NC19 TaxID=1004151 RepID=W3V8S2_9GAMM|nr:lysozyme [Photorhabdus khanii]ETS32232.1 phage-related lysozyme (muraminidase) [Photorhabdus khanii NC19]OHV55186.1 hypothetical protein BB987_08330 [Photorhabdus temperata]